MSMPGKCIFLLLLACVVAGCSSGPTAPELRVVNPMGLSGRMPAEAENSFSQARVLWRENFVAQAQQGEVCRDPQKAVQLLNKTVTLAPAYAPAYVRRGLAKSDLGQFGEAFDDLTTAIGLEPQASTYAYRALVSVRAKSPKTARPDIKRALELDDDTVLVWNVKALMEFALNDTKAACKSLEEACSRGDCTRLKAATKEQLCL